VDWLQCFQLKDVQIPQGSFIGISAMTGGLIDNHFFVQLSTYGNVEIQPYTYAHENNPSLQPQMWSEMKESGKVAREFADWEEHDSLFQDDLHWSVSDRVKPHLMDDYDDSYYGGNDNSPISKKRNKYEEEEEENAYTDYDEEDEEEYVGEDEIDNTNKKSKKINEKKSSITGKKIKINDDPGRKKLIEDLEKVFHLSTIGKKLELQHKENAKKMEKMHEQLTREMQKVTDDLHRAARDIRQKEHELSIRILSLGDKLKVHLINPFAESVIQTNRRGWFYPFLLSVFSLIGISIFGYTRYRKFMKSHVL